MYPRQRLLSRPQLVLTLLWLLLFCSAAVAQNTAATQIKPFSDRGSTPESPSNPLPYPPDTVYVPLLLNVTTGLEGWTEYNPNTCVDISTGSYTAPTKPMFGRLSTAIVDGPATGGPCAGTVFPFNVASYTWTKTTASAPQDFFSLQWTTPDGVYVEDSDWLAELLPQSETTKFQGWANSIGQPSIGQWQQTTMPSKVAYAGVTVQESDPGGGGPDTCWFAGSKFPPATSVTGGKWVMQAGNSWGFDYVGYTAAAVKYYRAKGRAPCGTTVPQQMQIQFATGDPSFYNYGPINTLTASIGVTTVSSGRQGKSETRTLP